MPAVGSLPQHLLSEESNTEFRLARLFYYLGMSFVAAGALRPLGAIAMSDWFFFASLTVAVGVIAFRGISFDPSLPVLFVFGFAVLSLGALSSLPVALHPLESASAFVRFIYAVFVWFALGAIILRKRRHVEIAIGAWILSIAISGLAAIAQVKWGSFIFASFTSVPTVGEGAFAGRQIGLSGHPNDLGGAAAVVVAPAILFVVSSIWTTAVRWAFMALLCLVLACIVLSGSVTAFGAGLASAGILLASGRVGLRRLVVVTGMLSLMSVALVLINQQATSSVLSPIDRLSLALSLQITPQSTGLDRLNLDALAWSQIMRNPLLGAGLDGESVAQVLGGVLSVHNMFLFVWVGAGIFGFLGLLTMTTSLVRSYLEELRRWRVPLERNLAFALGTSFVSFLIVSMAQPVVYIRYGWAPAALLVSLRAMRLRAERVAREGTLFNRGSLTASVKLAGSRPESRPSPPIVGMS